MSQTSATPKKKGEGNLPWTTRHSDTVTYGILKAAFEARQIIYALPGVVGEVDNHGCDRLGKQLVAALKQIAVARGLHPSIVDEIKADAKRTPGSSRHRQRSDDLPSGIGGNHISTPAPSSPHASGLATPPPTKRPKQKAKTRMRPGVWPPVEVIDVPDSEDEGATGAWIEELD